MRHNTSQAAAGVLTHRSRLLLRRRPWRGRRRRERQVSDG